MSTEEQAVAAEEAPSAEESPPATGGHAAHTLGNSTNVLGREIPLSLYTVVFVALALLTIIEVAIGTAEVESSLLTTVIILILLGLAAAKAVLVVMYYMHLRTDSRLFTYLLLFAMVIGALGIGWLLLVPPTGY